jgi:hypothetical protein
MNRLWSSILLCILFALVVLGASGCATDRDPENASVRPWNAPIGWENGIPSGMYQQH